MKNIKKLTSSLMAKSIYIALIIITILFFIYIFNDAFRCYLLIKNIDPNFIIGFSTVIALLVSFIQSSYDKKFNYNILLIESIRNKGICVIAKLLAIKNKSLDEIDESIIKAEKMNKKINDIAFEMNKEIVKKINDSTAKAKESFNFKL